MMTSRLKKAFEKKGLSVGVNGRKYFVQGSNYYTYWYDQEGSAICVCVTKNGQQLDSHTNYFPGSYAKTIKQAVAWTMEI